MRPQHPDFPLRRFLTVACGMAFLWTAGAPAQERRPLEVRDDLGRTLVLTSPARRIVSLAPSVTECLFAIGAGSQVAGVTDYCTSPEAARHKPRVGGMLNPSAEAIISLQPDLVVVSMEGNLKEDAARLTALQIPVFVTNPRTLAGIRTSIEQLGLLTGRAAEAAALAGALKRQEDSLRASVPRDRVSALLLVSIRPLMVVGRGTFLHELLEAAGADNIGARARGTYPSLSRESVLQADPEVLFLLSGMGADSTTLRTMYAEWPHLTAVRTGRVHILNADLFSRPGPRAVEGLAHLITLLHKRP